MADNYLITGYWGEPHVTAENDRGINAGIVGSDRYVLPVGQQFSASYLGNNTVRIYDGKLLNGGAAAGIPAGTYVDVLIPDAASGMKRNDIIVFQYTRDTSTFVESGTFEVISGTETSGTAEDPELITADLLTDTAYIDQMPLWRVSVSGSTISTPVQLFSVSETVMSIKGRATNAQNAVAVLNQTVSGKAPAYTYGTEDLTAGESALTTGTLHFVYE